MISDDPSKIVWHVSSRYPEPWELESRSTPIYHRCRYDTPVVELNEGGKYIEAETLEPGVIEFTCTHCGQKVRVSFNLWEHIREMQERR